MRMLQAKPAFGIPTEGAPPQEDRELAEALRVQAMGEVERSQWLQTVWGRAQHNAAVFAALAPQRPRTARSYASPDEKNQFDDSRELELALHCSVFATAKLTGHP